jgi:hypothetical protein
MYTDKYAFAQVVEFFNKYEFDTIFILTSRLFPLCMSFAVRYAGRLWL